jgi:hypothetical protein
MMARAPDMFAAADGVLAGTNPSVISDATQKRIVDALGHCNCKFMYRDGAGQHQETQLGVGLRKVARRGTYCAMHLENQNSDLGSELSPQGVDGDAIDRINLYISPPGSGAAMHFDTRWIVVVQLSGSKVWQVATEPAVDTPRHNVVADETAGVAHYDGIDLTLPDRMRFILLKPGDWLMVPWGTWHGTNSHDGSVSATLAFADAMKPVLPQDFAAQETVRFAEGPRLIC